MLEKNLIQTNIKDFSNALDSLSKHFDILEKQETSNELQLELEEPNIWQNKEKLKKLTAKKNQIDNILDMFLHAKNSLDNLNDLFLLLCESYDQELADELEIEAKNASDKIKDLENLKMFGAKNDANNCYLDLQSGSGGTEAQDWCQMLLRMYLRYCDIKNFKSQILEKTPGDVAGIKSATIEIIGQNAYGWLKTETGVHRLVRKSPFDSSNKRHTSFASAFIYPQIDDEIEIEIQTKDLKIDTYRASGAGGQHVNKTDSAIRITHLPTNIVVQCQNDRSQHKNKDNALKQLKAKLYEKRENELKKKQQLQEDSKDDITWGSQIRSYILDDSRVKDLRTKVETRNPQEILDGNLDIFTTQSLKQGV